MSFAPAGVVDRGEYGELTSPGQLQIWPIPRPITQIILLDDLFID